MTNKRLFRSITALAVEAGMKRDAAKAAGRTDEADHWSALVGHLQYAHDRGASIMGAKP